MVLMKKYDIEEGMFLSSRRSTETIRETIKTKETLIIRSEGVEVITVSKDGSGDTDSIQEAIDMLPKDTAGRIHIKAGTYELTTGITIQRDNVTIEGDGIGTIIKRKSDLGIDLITIGDGSNQRNGITLRNFKISDIGGSNTSDGIRILKTDFVLLERLYLENVHDNTIETDTNVTNMIIQNCYIDCEAGELTIKGSYVIMRGNQIVGSLWFYPDNSVVMGNIIDGKGGSYGDKCSLIGNTLRNGDENWWLSGDYNTAIGNVSDYGFSNDGGTGNKIAHNAEY